MKRILFVAALAIAACSDEPVGQSEYFDPWENSQLQSETPALEQSEDLIALNTQLEQNRLRNASRIAAQSGDAALVASLEAAIATAGNDQRAAQATQQSQAAQQTVATVNQGVQVQPVGVSGDGRISDNSFSSIVQKETIETDAAKLAALSQANLILEAQPLPNRNDGVNPAAFARSTTHNIGERLYKRASRSSASQRCRQYGNPDSAQRAFLAAGGPERDDLKLDPDGDGFVCGWSPIPFRNLRVGG